MSVSETIFYGIFTFAELFDTFACRLFFMEYSLD